MAQSNLASAASFSARLPRFFSRAVVVAVGACQPPDSAIPAATPDEAIAVTEIASPAGQGAGQPYIAPAGNGALLSWLEPVPGDSGESNPRAFSLKLARWDGIVWSNPVTVTTAADMMVNWADFPTVAELPDGRIVAHWLVRHASGGRYAYGVRIATSSDGGATWSAPVTPHTDGTDTEHGFVSVIPVGDAFGAAWLDGRNFAGLDEANASKAEMTLRYATIGTDGALSDEAMLDDRTCECCQTDATVTSSGPAVVYRDRAEGEIRDIAVVRLVNGKWTAPAIVHGDQWVFHGCPVNGPAIAAQEARVAVAWFTAANDSPRVRLAFSSDGGATFGAPVTVDDGQPAGRVDLLVLEDGAALVAWLENEDEGASVRLRRVSLDGQPGPTIRAGTASSQRAGGFPRMARSGDAALIAWTEPGPPSRLRLATVPLVTSRLAGDKSR